MSPIRKEPSHSSSIIVDSEITLKTWRQSRNGDAVGRHEISLESGLDQTSTIQAAETDTDNPTSALQVAVIDTDNTSDGDTAAGIHEISVESGHDQTSTIQAAETDTDNQTSALQVAVIDTDNTSDSDTAAGRHEISVEFGHDQTSTIQVAETDTDNQTSALHVADLTNTDDASYVQGIYPVVGHDVFLNIADWPPYGLAVPIQYHSACDQLLVPYSSDDIIMTESAECCIVVVDGSLVESLCVNETGTPQPCGSLQPLHWADVPADNVNTTYGNYSITSNVTGAQNNDVPTSSDSDTCKKRVRKRMRCPSKWKSSVRKDRRQSGMAYVTRKSVTVPAKVPRDANCVKCRFRCSVNFSHDHRLEICQQFYGLSDYNRQKDFICSTVMESDVRENRSKLGKWKKSKSRSYHLRSSGGILTRVCQKFYCKTLCISYTLVDSAFKGKGTNGTYDRVDGRKGRPAPNKTSPEAVDNVSKHINSWMN